MLWFAELSLCDTLSKYMALVGCHLLLNGCLVVLLDEYLLNITIFLAIIYNMA